MSKNLKWKIVYCLVLVLRFLSPLFVFSYPVFTIITVTFLDVIDAEFASQGVLSKLKYQMVDKILDNWWYLWALIYSYFALNNYFIFLLILFVYRLVGLTLFLSRKERNLFMFFPNLFENAFFILFIATTFGWHSLVVGTNLYFSLALVFILKIFQEYWLHIIQKSFVEDVFKFKWRKWLSD